MIAYTYARIYDKEASSNKTKLKIQKKKKKQ